MLSGLFPTLSLSLSPHPTLSMVHPFRRRRKAAKLNVSIGSQFPRSIKKRERDARDGCVVELDATATNNGNLSTRQEKKKGLFRRGSENNNCSKRVLQERIGLVTSRPSSRERQDDYPAETIEKARLCQSARVGSTNQ